MITHIFGKAVLAGAMILATTPPACAGTPPGGGSDGKPKACDMRVPERSGPRVFGKGPQQRISASLHVMCDVPPQTHGLEVWLERDVTASGNWLLQDDAQNPMWSITLPDAAGFDLTATFKGCITGRWRIMAKVNGVDSTGKPFKFNLPESETRPTHLTCTL